MHIPVKGVYSSRRKVLLRYLVTYLIIITLLFIVIGSFSYSKIIHTEQEKVKTEMEQAVNKVVSVMDTNLLDVLNIQSSFYTNPDVSRLRKLNMDFEAKEYMRFLDMSNKLSRYTSSGHFLDRITIYFHYNHLFIASDMIGSRPEIFFKLEFPNEHITYTQWRSEQMSQKSRIFFVTEDSTDNYVNLYYRLPILDPAKGVTVLTRIGVGEFIDNLRITDAYEDSALILTDSEGRILYSNREEAKALIHLAATASDSARITLGDTSYEWCSEKLSLINWTISFFVSTNDIYADSRSTQTNLTGLYLLMLVSSLVLSVIFSKRISDPVVSLLGLVDRWDGISSSPGTTKRNRKESPGKKNLYYVLRRVSDLSNDYKQLDSRIHEYKDLSRGIFYNRLLKGEIISADEIKMIEEDTILNFRHYTVAVARIISDDSKYIDIAMFAASEAFSGMHKHGLYFCKTAFDRFTLIIGTNECPGQSEITDVIESFFDRVYQNSMTSISGGFQSQPSGVAESPVEDPVFSSAERVRFDSLISLRWGIGDTVTHYDQIFASYRNAEYALYNMDVLDNKVIVWYGSTDKQKNRLIYNFDDAQRFYTLICNGDSKTTIQAIRELVKKNKEVLEASKGQRNRFISMLSEITLLSVSKFTNMDNQLEREIERILRQMKRADSIDTIIECISAAVEMLCLSIDSRNKNSYQRLIDKIIAFIDDNYSNPNLSLISIAQSMCLTESYISSFFKQNYGTNIHNYIEQKRMTKAAELLKGANLATTEIIEKTGYTNMNTFYKAFKRYYGITPKEYKLVGQQ